MEALRVRPTRVFNPGSSRRRASAMTLQRLNVLRLIPATSRASLIVAPPRTKDTTSRYLESMSAKLNILLVRFVRKGRGAGAGATAAVAGGIGAVAGGAGAAA